MKTELLKAIHHADLLDQVNDALKNKKDMLTPTFVSHEGLLCQWVTPSLCIYEYKLIVAEELDDLEHQANNLILLHYDFLFTVVLWNGLYLQWMHRMNDAGLTVRDAVVQVSAEQAGRLVEGGQEYLRLETAAKSLRDVVKPHYPILVS